MKTIEIRTNNNSITVGANYCFTPIEIAEGKVNEAVVLLEKAKAELNEAKTGGFCLR